MKKNTLGYLTLLRRLTPLVFRGGPLAFASVHIVGIFHGVAIGMEVVVAKYFFDAVAGVAAGGMALKDILPFALSFGGLLVLIQVINGAHNFMYFPVFSLLQQKLSERLCEKAARITPIAFESPALLDDINKAKEGIQSAVSLPMLFMMTFSLYLPILAVYGLLYYSLRPELLLSLLLVFAPTLVMLVVRTRLYADLEQKSAPLRRKYEYYEKAITDREYFKETRLLGAFSILIRLYKDAMALLNAHIWRTDKKNYLVEGGLRLVCIAGYIGILYLLLRFLLSGDITVGSFAAVFMSIGEVFGLMEELIVRHLGNIARDVGKVRNVVNFLDIKERPRTGALPKDSSIELKDVRFSYPGKDEPVIKGVSLTIRPGETVAFVGGNGAGKTTLMRLICGLYLPDSGDVKVGGVSTREADPRALYGMTSAVFQRFQRYRMTLRDNVELSSDQPGDAAAALEKADIPPSSASFPDGLNTMLSREFDGVDLSGGQWQRVAIARGYYRPHDIILLDEPTAAIDPIEESKIYGQFAGISRGKTALIVTHRMGSAKIADRIVVLDDGKIDDIGTHDELFARGGLYARMWGEQAKWYA